MKKKIIHLLENITEEILVGTIIAGCAVTQINTKNIFQKYTSKNKIEYAEFRQGEILGIARGDEFLLEKYIAPKEPINKEDLELLTQMIYLEASNCAFEERIAVGYTAINRTNIGGKDLGRIIKEPFQYSCFNDLNDDNIISKRKIAKKVDYIVLGECEDIARKIMEKEYKDPTNGATLYYNPEIIKKPRWNMDELERIGRIKTSKGESKHIFFKEKLKIEAINFSAQTYQPSS